MWTGDRHETTDATFDMLADNRPMLTRVGNNVRLVGGSAADHRWPLTEPFGLVGCTGPVWVHTEPGSLWPWRWSKTYACYNIDGAPGYQVVTSDDGIRAIGIRLTPATFESKALASCQFRQLSSQKIGDEWHALCCIDYKPFSFPDLDADLARAAGRGDPNVIALGLYAHHSVWPSSAERRLALEMLGSPTMTKQLAVEIRVAYRRLLELDDADGDEAAADPALLNAVVRMGQGTDAGLPPDDTPGYMAVVGEHLDRKPIELYRPSAD